MAEPGAIRGATGGGTTDLRDVALQFRWEISEQDTVVVQLAHQQRGNDIFSPKNDEVEVDWAFFERRLGADSTLKVGRLNIPLGIYNEVRDVGTLLPFFSLPVSFYSGVLSSAETVDGVSIAHTFASRSRWDLETELYLGGWDTFQQRVDVDRIRPRESARPGRGCAGRATLAGHAVPELRVGVGTLTWLLERTDLRAGQAGSLGQLPRLVIDARGDRWMLRAE